MNIQLYTVIDIMHQKIIGDFRMESLTTFFKTDDVEINLAIDNSEIIGDRYMISRSKIADDYDAFYVTEETIWEKPLSSKEQKISYIYRHLYKYGNTVVNDNPKKYQASVRLLGIDYDWKRIKDQYNHRYFYVLKAI